MADEAMAANRSLWDGWARLHFSSPFYDVEGFRAGKSSLCPVEVEEVGEVEGKTLLHLQCHFGLDTLSWARRGAVVTGVDFSEEAIALARALSAELGIPATFLCANVYDLPQLLPRQFDVVFTSYGVLGWLPDLDRWAEVVAHHLRPGGTFYMVEFHPVLGMLDEDGETLAYPYFPQAEPLKSEARGSYAVPDAEFTATAYEWPHSLGEVVTALLQAGLRLEFLHEFAYSTCGCWPFLQEVEPGKWVWKGRTNQFPHMFSVRATR